MIMNVSDKPFACNEKNCFMTFANEDHLNSHKKKHSMGFNLEFTGKSSETGDQTPTPTSFFRNCEEVGLFQDLQNVNPFEETFKKALENSENRSLKSGILSDVSNEDTLHTPHIFPSVEESLHENMLDINNSELSIINMIEIPQINDKVQLLNEISIQDSAEKQVDLKSKLKQALMKKDKLELNRNLEKKIETNKISNNEITKCTKSKDASSIERIRQINRAAQMKCRVKKKRQMDKMILELINLRKENVELKKENACLKQNNKNLWNVLEDLGETKESIIDKLTSLDKKNIATPKIPTSETNTKQLPLLAPAGSAIIPRSTPSAPILFNLFPVQLLKTDTLNGISIPLTSISSELKRPKISPRIIRKT
ncbi:uncharacterized protein LOC123308400 isoform X2 [Coccinella septempunctata]|uniref:uncharacterized protein LOC123308400 isoform X2 n=1 Tax=Coccinella septempunctata TaxID=41139 RepID=UPI001D0909E6|nr:uncharacterized protein LOC123308400 isoform X2 [Coccinella septempunctata]